MNKQVERIKSQEKIKNDKKPENTLK